MMRLRFAIGFMGALALNACSSNSTSPPVDAAVDTGPPLVTISGTAAPHPLTPLVGMNPADDFSTLAVAVVDPSVVLANPSAPPLAGAPLDPTKCTATGCTWSFDNVNISSITLGLVGIIDDLRTPAASRLWVKTGTGAGASDFIDMIKVSRAPITNRTLFVVSKATEAKLATFSQTFITPTDATLVPGALETRGFMIGTVVAKLSQNATPVAGAVITTTDTRTTILYPSADFMSNGTMTASHGTFLVVPKPVTPQTSIVTTWSVTPPSNDTRVWPMLTAGSTPGTAFVILFAANETP